MKTLLEAILSSLETCEEDAKKTVKESVLQEDDTAKVVKTKSGFSIRSGRTTLGKGLTEEHAWGEAALNFVFGRIKPNIG